MMCAKSLRWHDPDQVMRVELALLSAIEGSPFKYSNLLYPRKLLIVKS